MCVNRAARLLAALRRKMTNLEKLQEWCKNEKRKGLVDIKLFRGSDESATIEEMAGSLLSALLNEESAVDITNDPL